MPAQINITAEGRTCTVPAGFPLADFLKSCGLVPRQVRVVRNGLTLTPGEIATVTLENGDMLEIVKIGADG
ncbi:MAG: thiamine biosynthesis protein ThiS [Opitutaceae bacterium]|jgi:sulfur carrier protein ThiS